MQTLDIISVNLWQILISLANLALLFFIVKKFLFAPVKAVFAQREEELGARYAAADAAKAKAEEDREAWESKLSTADAEATAILDNATDAAKRRGDRMIAEARERADGIIRTAEVEAELERQKAQDSIRAEIVEVSGAIAEKMLGREINVDDHRALIDSFLEDIGDDND